VTRHFEGEDTIKEIPETMVSCEEFSKGKWACLMPWMFFWVASMSTYIDQMSQRLGWESTMPSKIVFPRSGSPCLYSNCANLDAVLISKETGFHEKMGLQEEG
jgi:hypothetical protein